MATKTCVRCAETKSVTEFHSRKVASDGLNAACKACICAVRRQYHKDNLEKEHASAKAWREATREQRDEAVKAWRSANREYRAEYARRYDEANREVVAARKRAHYEANREWYLSRAERNPEATRANRRNYNERHPGRRAAAEHRRRAAAMGSEVSEADLDSLWNGLCGICTEPLNPDLRWPHPRSRSIDHIVPLSKGGAHVQANLQWSHLRCNISKGAKLPDTA